MVADVVSGTGVIGGSVSGACGGTDTAVVSGGRDVVSGGTDADPDADADADPDPDPDPDADADADADADVDVDAGTTPAGGDVPRFKPVPEPLEHPAANAITTTPAA